MIKNTENPSIFRANALKHYFANQQQAVKPSEVSSGLLIWLWGALFLVCVGGAVTGLVLMQLLSHA